MSKPDSAYYQSVSDYYDTDADMGFEARAEANPLLEKIRNDFRAITMNYPSTKALEIGCGPGYDVAWFAATFPEKEVVGVDISGRMIDLAQKRISKAGLKNASVLKADERQLPSLYSPGNFDLVFVFFGALNTVADLNVAATRIWELLPSGGHAVLTFVNKWYFREMAVQSLKLRFDIALARLKKEWGGYSPQRHLPSRCYSPGQIKKAFKNFTIVQKKGYSIFFPAWYNYKKVQNKQQKLDKLWYLDASLQNSFLWSKGEYTLYVFRKD